MFCDASDLVGKPFVDTRCNIKRFWTNPNNIKRWELSIVHRVRNANLYRAPILLITEGFKNDFTSVAAISYTDAVYKSSLTGIKGLEDNATDVLRRIAGILNSSFFSYYNLMTFSSAGIEREQSHDEEKWQLPYSDSDVLSRTVENLERLLVDKYNVYLSDCETESLERNLFAQIDKTINNAFSISSQESELLSYANDIIIPIIQRHKGFERVFTTIRYDEILLNEYANLFIERFKSSLDNDDRKFVVEIWHTEQIVGMFFRMIPSEEYEKDIVWINKQNDASLLSFLSKIGGAKITDKLFVQKDIRGFDNNGEDFFIVKPNERRLWHQAIGYVDVDEFADAILKAGRDGL